MSLQGIFDIDYRVILKQNKVCEIRCMRKLLKIAKWISLNYLNILLFILMIWVQHILFKYQCLIKTDNAFENVSIH